MSTSAARRPKQYKSKSKKKRKESQRVVESQVQPSCLSSSAAVYQEQQLIFDLRSRLAQSETKTLQLTQSLGVLTEQATTAAVQADARYVPDHRALNGFSDLLKLRLFLCFE
jgi:hypothetical protein